MEGVYGPKDYYEETKSEETVAFTGRLIYRYNESVNYESK